MNRQRFSSVLFALMVWFVGASVSSSQEAEVIYEASSGPRSAIIVSNSYPVGTLTAEEGRIVHLYVSHLRWTDSGSNVIRLILDSQPIKSYDRRALAYIEPGELEGLRRALSEMLAVGTSLANRGISGVSVSYYIGSPASRASITITVDGGVAKPHMFIGDELVRLQNIQTLHSLLEYLTKASEQIATLRSVSAK